MKKLLVTVCVVFIAVAAFANGDPTTRLSALTGSANPTPLKIADIQVISEKLYIRPGKYSFVQVKYVLFNNSDKDYIDIDYGFPVDYEGGGEKYENSGLVSDYYSESLYTMGWHDDYIKQINFSIDGKALPYKASKEALTSKPEKAPNRSDYDSDEEYEGDLFYYEISGMYRRWFYTQFSIKKNESVTLEVSYAIRNSQRKPAYSPASASSCSLQYDLSPATHWGNGKASDFFVQIDASEVAITPDYYETDKPIASGLDFTRVGNSYTYQATNFKFKDTISLEYTLVNDIDLGDLLKRRVQNDEYTLRVSDEQSTYPAANLTDMDFTTAWVSAKNGGIGQKLVIEFKKPTKLEGLYLINGYHKSEKSYTDNSRLKTVSAVAIAYCKEDGEEDKTSEFDIDFNPAKYSPLGFENLKTHADVYYISLEYLFYACTVKRIELEIKEVYPGAKYNDLCVSEILIIRRDAKQ